MESVLWLGLLSGDPVTSPTSSGALKADNLRGARQALGGPCGGCGLGSLAAGSSLHLGCGDKVAATPPEGPEERYQLPCSPSGGDDS